MADTTIAGLGTKAAPLDYKIPKALEVLPRSIKASFNGASAGGAFLPTVQIIADTNDVVGSYPVDTAVAAGASADVSWFPRLGRPSTSGGLGTCGEPDVPLANPGIYLAAKGNKDTLLTLAPSGNAHEFITCTHAVASGDYVVMLAGIGSVLQSTTVEGDLYNCDFAAWALGGGFTANLAQNPSEFVYVAGVSGPDLGLYTGGAGGTNILTFATQTVLSNAVINIGDTFRIDYAWANNPDASMLIGPRAYAVVGIPAAALAAGVTGPPSLSAGGSTASGGAPGFEYLMPPAVYAPNAPQDMAHIYCIASGEGVFTTPNPLDFSAVQSHRLASIQVGLGADPQPDPTLFWFDVAYRLHRNSYAGSCFRILVPPSAGVPNPPRWSAAGTTVLLATSS